MGNNSHPINGLMDSSLQNLRSLVDADTIIGEAITAPDGTIIIPVSKVSFGFVSGGSDIPSSKQPELFGGGAGGGVLAGLWFRKVSARVLHIALGLLILFGGARLLLW